MPFLLPNQQRQNTESKILYIILAQTSDEIRISDYG